MSTTIIPARNFARDSERIVETTLDMMRDLIRRLERENIQLLAEVKRLAEQNNDLCDTVFDRDQMIAELQGIIARSHTGAA